jgi:hypothetical protein
MPGNSAQSDWDHRPPSEESLPVSRRMIAKSMALGALLFTVDGAELALSPSEAHAASVPLQTLTPAEAATLEAVSEVLLPGSAKGGIANYVDHGLSVPPGDCLLGIRLTDGLSAPYAPVYQKALAAVDGAAQKAYGGSFASLPADKQVAFVKAMATGQPDGWQGPPAGGVYRLLRNDALDVIYAVPEGYAAIGVPYMPHIFPDPKW